MKIHCIIQARYGSTRLPGKIVAKINGITMLEMVFQRCLSAANIDKVVLAVHGDKNMDLDWHKKYMKNRNDPQRYHSVRGYEEPAARFVSAIVKYPCDGFVRVCADSPFIDHEVIDEAAQAIIDGKDYFLAGKGMMHGNQAEGFNTQAFLKAEPNMQGDEREHLGLWFQRRDRLTVDTPADLERARLIVSRMTKPHTEYTAAECLELLRGK